jgi:DNA phosphorothioation-associated putative methyltransferase
VVVEACHEAASDGLGYLDGDHSLQLHAPLVRELPPVLRVLVGCAAQLYGEVEAADLVKIHMQSRKLSLMTYDDFDGRAVPDMIERVKIDLARQRIDFFEYGEEFDPQPLYLKSRFMAPGQDGYDEQKAFDDAVEALAIFDFSDHGPPRGVFEGLLGQRGLVVEGFALVPAS